MPTIAEMLAQAIESHRAGDLRTAEQIYRQILAADTNHVSALYLLGMVAHQTGELEPAQALFRRAVEIKPDFAEAHNNLGTTCRDLGRLADAVASYRRAVELKPNYAEAHHNLAKARLEQGESAEAAACCQRAIAIEPAYAAAYDSLGTAWKEQGKLDEAVGAYRRAVELQPGFADAVQNLAAALFELARYDEAAALQQRALELNPHLAEAHWNRASIRLLHGQFDLAWPEYEWRVPALGPRFAPRSFPQPVWDGRPLGGSTILLHAEQGLGDTIQFIRYAALVKQRGGTVIVECQPQLARLLKSCAGIDVLIARGEQLPRFERHAPLLSLPRIFGTTLDTIPAEIPYLSAETDLIDRWQAELAAVDGFKIGIAWHGNPLNPRNHIRSFPASCLAPLARVPGVRLYSLQQGPGSEQLAALDVELGAVDLAGRVSDFADTAAVMKCLDLVISCESAPAHLAGALGVPVWVALPLVPDWRWLLARADSPWYPTMRLFRQRTAGDWSSVFAEIAAACFGLIS